MDFTGIIINNRYKLIKKLAEGRTSFLYLAHLTGRKTGLVAVKIFKDNVTSKKTGNLIRFKHNVYLLSQLKHPNIICIYDVGEVYGLQFVVMEYLKGQVLQEAFKGTIPPTEYSISIIVQTARALDCLHRNGITHRDLKPGHLIILDDTEYSDHTLKLMDGGFNCIKDFSQLAQSEDIAELIGHLSPEQSGLIKRQVDGRSDLYSLGVIFYQMLTGRSPFPHDDSLLFLHRHKSKGPELPSHLNSAVYPVLDRIVLKLLENEPEKRYQSAEGLLFDLERCRGGEREFIAGLNDASIRLTYRTRLVGRDREVERLSRLLDSAIEGSGGACLIGGDPGIGKTRLIEELLEYARSKGAAAIYAKCFPGENKEPFGLLKESLNAYLKIFNSYSGAKKKEIKNRIKTSVGGLGEIILKVNPEMVEILGECPSMPGLEPGRENMRFLNVASRFFLNLSAFEHGLVISLDDLQWCDEGSFELIRIIIDEAPKSSLLIVGAFRTSETKEGRLVSDYVGEIEREKAPLTVIGLENLSGLSMNEFVSGLLYEDEASAREKSEFIFQKSKGNPFFAIEILKQLVEEKAICYKNNRWAFDHAILRHSIIPITIIDTIIKRISLLRREEAMVLSYAAVIGKDFNIELLFRLLVEYNKNDLIEIIDKCVQFQLLDQDVNDSNNLSFVHDRIREAFSGNIDPQIRKAMHARIAETIEELYKDNKNEVLFDLTRHYLGSGNREKVFEYAYPASFKAAEAFANEDALRYFGLAADLLDKKLLNGDESSRALWLKSKEGMAKVYLRIGRYDEAIKILNEMLPYAEDALGKALLLSKISSAYYKKGDWQSCEENAKIGIELLGGALPVKRGAVLVSLAYQLFVHCVHILMPGLFVTKRRTRAAVKKMYLGIFYESLINMYILSERLKYVRAVLKILNHVESYIGEGMALAKVFLGYGTLLMSFTRFKDALKYFYMSLEKSKEINDQYCTGRSYELIGYCHEWHGEYRDAIENYTKALEIFSSIGDSHEMGITLNGMSNSYFFLAEYENLKKTNKKFFELASNSHDHYQMCNALIFRAVYYLGTGNASLAEASTVQANTLSKENRLWMPYCITHILLGTIYQYSGAIEKSISHFEKAKELYEKHRFLKYYTILIYPHFAEAYLLDFCSKKSLTKKQKNYYIRRIGALCKTALKETERWVSFYHYSLIVAAKYFALIGKNTKAEKYFLRGIEYSAKVGMKFDHANGLFEYGLFLAHKGEPETSRKNIESAYQIFSEIGARTQIEKLSDMLGFTEEKDDSSSLQRSVYNKRRLSIDRLSAKINQILELDEFFNSVISNAVEITCAGKGFLFIADDKGKLELKARVNSEEDDISLHSQEIIAKVFKDCDRIITNNAEEMIQKYGSRGASVSAGKLILCVPIKIKDKVIGVCHMENLSSDKQFTEEDAELLLALLANVSTSLSYAYLYQNSKTKKSDAQWIITPTIERKMREAVLYLKENYRFDIAREGLAHKLELNSDNLGRYFRMYTGEKLGDYINRLRIDEAAKKLKETDENVIHIAYSVGFENISTFNKAFIKYMKTTPTNYRKLMNDASN